MAERNLTFSSSLRSYTQGGSGVHIEGLDEFRRGLRHLSAEARKDWSAFNRELATEAAGWAKSEATGMGSVFRHFAPSLFGSTARRSAAVGMRSAGPRQRWWGAAATFWGAYRPQHPPWVGDSWDVAPGQGPYAIVPALLNHDREIVDRYGDLIETFASQAFPDGGDKLKGIT